MSLQLPLGLRLPTLKTFSRFIPADNTFAVEMLQAFVTQAKEQQIYIFGPSAVGKTHLLQAVCHLAHQVDAGDKADKRVAYIPLRQMIHESPDCLEGLASLDIICIDDSEAVAGKPAWEVALFNLINECRAHQTQLLFSATESPSHYKFALADLRSRLQWGPAIAIKALADPDKKTLLQALAKSKGLTLEARVAEYILQHHRRDVRSLVTLFDTLDSASLANARSLTIPFVKQVLQQP